ALRRSCARSRGGKRLRHGRAAWQFAEGRLRVPAALRMRGGAAAPVWASFVAMVVLGVKSFGVWMLFGKRKQVVKRILIVEDEPLTAFDNENMLGDAGYEIVATVDDLEEALEILEREEVHLILSDVRLRKQQTGIHLAKT